MKKKLKCFIATLTLAIVTTVTINLTLTSNNNFGLLLDNREALATPETGGGNVLVGDCWESVVIIPDCKVTCVCGRIYHAQPRVPHAMPHYVTGKCPCGNTIFPQ